MATTTINWFPGHMRKTQREIKENLKLVEAVIEIRDARIPRSSANPDIEKLCGNKPRLILLNKSDLTESRVTREWMKELSKDNVKAIEVNCLKGKGLNQIKPALEELLKEKLERYKAKGLVNVVIRVMVVGIPNVGKSTLFNAIVNKRISIVEDIPGVTRDRIYFDAEWLNREFTMIDTGGIEFVTENSHVIPKMMRLQAELAIEEADVILFVVDGKQGIVPADEEVANILRTSGKPVVLVVNKIDSVNQEPNIYEFYNLGLGDPIGISAKNLMNLGDLLDDTVKHFPPVGTNVDEEDTIHVAIIGRPNVGKSSLTNALLGQDRVIVSDVAGTTRDSIDTHWTHGDQKFVLIDTAGMRRKSKIDEAVERYSIVRSLRSVDRSDIVVLVLDGVDGVTEQDKKIAGYAYEAGKGVIIVVNKWDLVEKDDKTTLRYTEDIYDELGFLQFAPILFASALTKQRIHRLADMLKFVSEQQYRRVSTGTLNQLLQDAQTVNPVPSRNGRIPKIYYMTQASVKPPTFILFVNEPELIHFSYMRFLENRLRESFGFEGTPIRLILRGKKREDEE